jgi:hypothetical protein
MAEKPPTTMSYPYIEAILDEGGDISVGRVGPIDCVASATTSYDCPVMLVRRDGESFVALLRRLDRSIGKAWANETTIDEVND